MKQYYDTRAPEYDDWYLGLGTFAERARPGWVEELEGLEQAIGKLSPARTLDVACGTGYLTRHLRGETTALDQSEQMLAITRRRVPGATVVLGDGLELPFPDGSFERVFTGHFYGHLDEQQRQAFLAGARRLAPELVIVDSALRPDHEHDEWQERVLRDGSRFQVFKRYFDADGLARELGGGRPLHRGRWFVMVTSRARGPLTPPALPAIRCSDGPRRSER